MHIVALSGTTVGTKTRTAMDYAIKALGNQYPDVEVTLIDLAKYAVQFSDGRQYGEYEGDTKLVAQTVMNANAVMIGTPVFRLPFLPP